MIVEYVGPPGAGKTTIIQARAAETGVRVLDMVDGHGPDGTRPGRKARRMQWTRAIASNPRFARFWWSRVTRDKDIFRHALEASRRDWIVRRLQRRGGSWLVDEGPLHRLLWVLAWSGWDGDLRSMGLVAADEVAVVGTPAEVAFERVTARGGENTVLGLPAEERLKALRRYSRLASQLAAL
jgi:hypothetical protein